MKKNPVGTLIVLVAAVISFLGLVLPFYSVDFLGQKMSVSLMSIDGEIQVIAIVWAAFIVLALLFALIGKKVPVLIFALLGAIGLFLSYTLNNSELEEYGAEVTGIRMSDDNNENIEKCIRAFIDEGCDLVVCTGGMSVDPDDKTPLAIRNVCGSAVTYGAPVLPGAMFMLAYYGDSNIPVMGLPGCVMYARRTIFDIVLPRVMTGEILEKKDFDILGEGGLCLSCEICTFPNCGFGK